MYNCHYFIYICLKGQYILKLKKIHMHNIVGVCWNVNKINHYQKQVLNRALQIF